MRQRSRCFPIGEVRARISTAGENELDVCFFRPLSNRKEYASVRPAPQPLQERKLAVDCATFPPFADHGTPILSEGPASFLPSDP
jgi:hypothetical protein